MPRGGREGRYLHLADEDLISLVGSDDARAFAALYDRHARAAYWLAYRMTGGRQAAEDLTQEAFLKVWRSSESYRPERGSVRTWILTIVHNRGIDRMRSAASRRRAQDRAEAEAVAARHEPSEAFAEAWRGYRRDRRGYDGIDPEVEEDGREHLRQMLETDDEFRREWEANRTKRELGMFILEKRLERGLSQRELAERVGTSQNRIYVIENGEADVRLATLQRLAEALGFPLVVGDKTFAG